MGIIGANNPDACHTCDGGSNPPGTEFQQNNVAVTISAGYFIKPALGEFSMIDKVVQKLNAQTFTITEIQTPVTIVAFEQQGLIVKRKYKYIFRPGKGKYGIGGTTITTADLEYWVSETFTDIDAGEDPNTIVVDLGDLPLGDYLNAANGAERDFNDTEKRYFVSYTKDGVGYLVMFVGDYGYYGGTYPDDFTAEDFVPTYDTTMPPNIVYTSQLVNNGANGTDPFATVSELAAVNDNAVKKTGSTLQTIIGNITLKGKLLIEGIGSILDGSAVNALFKKVTSTENIEINTAVPTLPNHAVRKDYVESLTNGMTLSVNQASAEMYLKNSIGTTLATLNLGFLNNEGTTFFYNETTQKLELKNDAGEVLSAVPVSAFVSNLIQSVSFSGAIPSLLEFKDASGNLVDLVTITINNVSGLQEALNGKANTNGTNATGTWPIHITGNSGNSFLWNSMPINLSSVSPSTDYLLGNKNSGGVLLDASGVKLWLAIAITDVLGLATTLAGYATSLAGKANLTGGNSFSGNQNITGLLDVNGDINLGSGRNITWGGRYIDGNPTIAANSAGIGFYPSGGDTAMYITAARAIGIGKDNPTYKFDTNGIGRFKREGVNGAGLVGVLIAASDSKTVGDGVLQAFQGLNQTNEDVSYGSIAAFIESSLTGAHSGRLEFRTYQNAIAILALRLNKDGSAKFYSEVEVPAGTSPGSAINKQQLDNAIFSTRPYKVYTARLAQSGTSAPVATVLENTIEEGVTWVRGGLGQYSLTFSSGKLTANKTIVSPIQTTPPYTNHAATGTSGSQVSIITTSNGGNTDGLLTSNNSFIEIRVYN